MRKIVPAPMECDPESRLMSEPAVMRFLGTDSKGVVALIKQNRLKRDPLTGSFARVQVQAVHDEILRGILNEDGATVGQQQQAMGMLDGFRTHPHLV